MKRLNIAKVLEHFTGEHVKKDGDTDLTLKDVLLTYVNSAGKMGLSDDEQIRAFDAGMKIGRSEIVVDLEQREYDTIKKLADKGKAEVGGKPQPVFGLVVQEQVKRLVDRAEHVDSEESDGS